MTWTLFATSHFSCLPQGSCCNGQQLGWNPGNGWLWTIARTAQGGKWPFLSICLPDSSQGARVKDHNSTTCCIPQGKKCVNIDIHIYIYLYNRYICICICINEYALYRYHYVLPLYHLPVRPEGMWKRGVWTSWPFSRTTRKQGKHPMVMCWCAVSGESLGRRLCCVHHLTWYLRWPDRGYGWYQCESFGHQWPCNSVQGILRYSFWTDYSGSTGDVGWAWTMFVFPMIFS